MCKPWFFLLFLSASVATAQKPFTWKPIDIGDQKYVSLEQVKTFYQFDNMEREKKKIILTRRRNGKLVEVEMHLDLDSQKMHMNRVLFYTSLPIKSRENDPQIYVSQMDLVTLIDPILRPGSIKNAAPFRTVILDPGHGGKDKGAAGMEAAETLKLALAIKEELQNLGHIVVMTREENVFVPLEERVEIAKANPKAIMISLHFNSGPKDAQGIETYIMSAREPNAQNRASIALATAVHSRTMIYINGARGGKNFGMTDRGIRRAKFNILKHSPCPTILMEAGYLTNKEDAEKIKNPDFQKTLAAAVVRGVLVYKKSIQKR